jgi:hypothetical protein
MVLSSMLTIYLVARLMRYLATHHVYKEIKPDVFTNTRISSMLDTGKSVEELFASFVVVLTSSLLFLMRL